MDVPQPSRDRRRLRVPASAPRPARHSQPAHREPPGRFSRGQRRGDCRGGACREARWQGPGRRERQQVRRRGGVGPFPCSRARAERPRGRVDQYRGGARWIAARRHRAAPAHLLGGPLGLLAEGLGLGGHDLDGDGGEPRAAACRSHAGVDCGRQRGGRAALWHGRRHGVVGLQDSSPSRSQ